jgi:hypothetical protein
VGSEVTIVCPTHGRPGQVHAYKTFGPDLLLSVADSQVPAYRDAYPDARIDPHPDTIIGLPAKKQMLLDKFGAVFWVDDDAGQMIDHTDSTKVDPAKARDLVQRTADTAAQMGAFLFGFSMEPNPLYYKPHAPFALTGMMGGGKFGVLPGSKLWYPDDPHVGFWEDLWMGALNAFHHRFMLCDLRYCIPTSVGQGGGLANMRTDATLWAQVGKMTSLFGDAIVLKDKQDVQLYPWRLKVLW